MDFWIRASFLVCSFFETFGLGFKESFEECEAVSFSSAAAAGEAAAGEAAAGGEAGEDVANGAEGLMDFRSVLAGPL